MDETTKLLDERQKTHGDFDDFARVYQDLCKVCTEKYLQRTPRQNAALDMICNKLARVITGDPNFDDHWDDIKGYAQLGKQGHKPEEVESLAATCGTAGIGDIGVLREPHETMRQAYERSQRPHSPPLVKYQVDFYYLATGMDGIADERDHGIVYAESKEAATRLIIKRDYALNHDGGDFAESCLSATEVILEDSNV